VTVALRNGGVPRRISFNLMRECQVWIHADGGSDADEIRCNHDTIIAYAALFPDYDRRQWESAPFRCCAWDRTPILQDETVPVGEMWWFNNGERVGVIADLWVES